MIRAPIVVVGGHIDHGKTTLLDYLRGTNIAEKEAGRITQHIGATEISLELIKKQAKGLIQKYGFNLKIPGLLFIDTPGHDAFATLRERGCGIADIGVVVIDILQGVQPQTVEVIEYLKQNKTPFVVAVTKIDKIKGYPTGDLKTILKEVDENKTLYAQEFNEKLYKIMGQLSELGFDSERFDFVTDFTKKVLLIPLSSKTGVGIPELLLFLAGLSQKYLEANLALNVEGYGKAVVLDINETKGFGKTCDIILYDGVLRKGDFVKIKGKNNFFVTKIKQLLRPNVLSDLRTVTSFKTVDCVSAAAGLKVVFNDPDLVDSGDEFSVITKEDAEKLEKTKKTANTVTGEGIIVKADTQGSLDAIFALACKNKVNIGKLAVGNLTKEDILEAKLFARDNFLYGAIFAFNLKVSPELEQYARQEGIVIFSSNVIYKLFEDYEKWCREVTNKKREEELKDVKYPVKLQILKDYIFRKSKPAIFGVKILDGILKPGIKVIWEGKEVGTIKQIQIEGKVVAQAEKEQEVAVSSEDINFEKNIDLNLSSYLYVLIPASQRPIVKKYLFEEYPDLITEIFDIYEKYGL